VIGVLVGVSFPVSARHRPARLAVAHFLHGPGDGKDSSPIAPSSHDDSLRIAERNTLRHLICVIDGLDSDYFKLNTVV